MGELQVGDELLNFSFYLVFVGEAEEVAGVDGGDDFGGEVREE